MNLINLISLQNPWWEKKNLPQEVLWPKRLVFNSFYQEVIGLKQIIALVGLRRVGKTTLIKQIISMLLKNNINEKNIFYFSFDQALVEESYNFLDNLINFYFEKIKNKKINQTEKIYIFFDEIQLIPFWQDVLKRYYDLNQNIKFIVSGSSSLFIKKKSKESLAGRIFERSLAPLSFEEFKIFSKKNNFEEYLDFGQFPELLNINLTEKKKDYLKEGIVDKVLEIDIPKVYHLRRSFDFKRLFWVLLSNTSWIIKSLRLMTDLSIKKATFFNYLDVLENSLLVFKILNLSGSFRGEKRLLRKIYPSSVNFLFLLPEKVSYGTKVENYVAQVLKNKFKDVYLYRLKDKEIDFVIPDKKIAFEVKWQEKIIPDDYRFLEKFTQEKKYQGFLITKNQEAKFFGKKIKNIYFEELENFLNHFI
ncbi:MAG: ATP-binding protein [Patescibacteria group bacterium]|nr:ATP-binding protein [Patescibacteria group bacterium]